MGLTKKECKKACEDLLYIGCDSYYRELRDEIVKVFKRLINEHFKLKRRYKELEKALDKACEKLEDLEWGYSLFDLDYAESNLYHTGRTYSTKEEWKEYLLKEVKEK